MGRYMPTCRRASLAGWWCWLLALAPLFSVVAFDTWLNTENLRKDYAIATLNGQLKTLREELDALKVEQASLEALDRIEIEAPDIGLVPPEPDQIRIIYSARSLDAPENAAGGLRGNEGDGSFASELEQLLKGYLLDNSGEGIPWQTNSAPNLASTTPVGNLLRKAISSACAYYAGRS